MCTQMTLALSLSEAYDPRSLRVAGAGDYKYSEQKLCSYAEEKMHDAFGGGKRNSMELSMERSMEYSDAKDPDGGETVDASAAEKLSSGGDIAASMHVREYERGEKLGGIEDGAELRISRPASSSSSSGSIRRQDSKEGYFDSKEAHFDDEQCAFASTDRTIATEAEALSGLSAESASSYAANEGLFLILLRFQWNNIFL